MSTHRTHATRTRPVTPHPRNTPPEGVFSHTTRSGRLMWYVRLIATGFNPRLYRYETKAEAEALYASYDAEMGDLLNDLDGTHVEEWEDAPLYSRASGLGGLPL